jgi:hypothetical protein
LTRISAFNCSIALGAHITQACYFSTDQTAASLLEETANAIVLDALTTVFREFWPEIATRVFLRRL